LVEVVVGVDHLELFLQNIAVVAALAGVVRTYLQWLSLSLLFDAIYWIAVDRSLGLGLLGVPATRPA
jgi:hypothetical protein